MYKFRLKNTFEWGETKTMLYRSGVSICFYHRNIQRTEIVAGGSLVVSKNFICFWHLLILDSVKQALIHCWFGMKQGIWSGMKQGT